MRSTFACKAATLQWDPAQRIFDYRARPPGPTREDKEALSRWIEAHAGPDARYGLLVERELGLRGERISGFSLAELIQRRDRMVVACVGVTRTEEIMIPVVAALAGIRMETFASRDEALAWLSTVTATAPREMRQIL